MKKTLIALLAMAGMATAAVPYWESDTVYELDSQATITSSTIGETSGYIITKTNNNTSPAPLIMNMEFSLSSFGTVSEHLVSFIADTPYGNSAYGFNVASNGTLSFGRSGPSNITSTTDASTFDSGFSTTVTTLSLNTNYNLMLQSHATPDADGNPGRGSDNFTIILTNLDNTSASPVEMTWNGFGLNGNRFEKICIGSNLTGGTMAGTVSKLSIVAPEPATATLSLLALAGMAARRRR